MDAVKFLKTKMKMCGSLKCNDCPLSMSNNKIGAHAMTLLAHTPNWQLELLNNGAKNNKILPEK